MSHVVEAVADEFPLAFRRAHRGDQPRSEQIKFVTLLVQRLNALGEKRFGLNGKRGNQNDPSLDAISYIKGNNPADVEVIDVIASAGTLNDDGSLTAEARAKGEAPSRPYWNDVTAFGPGYFIPVDGTSEPPPPPPPPPSVTCRFQPTDLNGIVRALGETNQAVAQLGAILAGKLLEMQGQIEEARKAAQFAENAAVEAREAAKAVAFTPPVYVGRVPVLGTITLRPQP